MSLTRDDINNINTSSHLFSTNKQKKDIQPVNFRKFFTIIQALFCAATRQLVKQSFKNLREATRSGAYGRINNSTN